MHAVATRLRQVLELCTPLLLAIPPAEARRKPAPGKWSKQEILGHLLDSAGNNQQKFVRLINAEAPLEFVGYEQDAWVEAQRYQQTDWRQLVSLWRAFNDHLAHVIEHVPHERLDHTIRIDGKGPFTLAFVISDYVEHLTHHLREVLPQAGLASAFANVYGA